MSYFLSIQQQRFFPKFAPQAIDRVHDAWSTQQLLFQSMLAGEVEQHNPEQNGQKALTGNAGQRQHDPERDQQHAADVFADHRRHSQRRISTFHELSLARLGEVIRGKFDEN